MIIPDTVWRAVKTELDKIKSNWSIHGKVKWQYFAPGNSAATNTMLHLSQNDKNSVRNEIYEILAKRRSIKLLAVVRSVPAAYACANVTRRTIYISSPTNR